MTSKLLHHPKFPYKARCDIRVVTASNIINTTARSDIRDLFVFICLSFFNKFSLLFKLELFLFSRIWLFSIKTFPFLFVQISFLMMLLIGVGNSLTFSAIFVLDDFCWWSYNAKQSNYCFNQTKLLATLFYKKKHWKKRLQQVYNNFRNIFVRTLNTVDMSIR